MPMLDKLRRSSGSSGSGSKRRGEIEGNINNNWVEKPPEIKTVESRVGITRQLPTCNSNSTSGGSKTLASRDRRGITVGQGFGTFPHDVVLNIRHDHPTLGLGDVAQHRLQRQKQQQQQMRHRLSQTPTREVALTPAEARGVLSLGLPVGMTLFRNKNGKEEVQQSYNSRRRSLPRKLTRDERFLVHRRQVVRSARSVTSLEDEDEDDEEDANNSTSTSGLSSQTSSDNNNQQQHLPHRLVMTSSPSSRPVPFPRTFTPCPPVKMHPRVTPRPQGRTAVH